MKMHRTALLSKRGQRLSPCSLDSLQVECATKISKNSKTALQPMKANLDNEAVFLEENQRFHDPIAASSDNPIFGHLMNALLDIIDGAPIGVEYPKHRRQIVYEAHQSIYETLARKDANAAAAAMYEHILQYAEYVEDNFPEVP